MTVRSRRAAINIAEYVRVILVEQSARRPGILKRSSNQHSIFFELLCRAFQPYGQSAVNHCTRHSPTFTNDNARISKRLHFF